MPMNSRERVEAALNHEEPDRTPIFEYVLLSPVADEILGEPFKGDFRCWGSLINELGWAKAVREIARDIVRLAAILEHDMIYSIPGPAPPTHHFGAKRVEIHEDLSPVERVRRRNVLKSRQLSGGPLRQLCCEKPRCEGLLGHEAPRP